MNVAPYQNEVPPHREVLPGGTVLLSVPMRTAHAVTFGVWLRTGSQDEARGLGGVSHFIEHMVFKGTQKYSALDIAVNFDRIGASVDAFTTKDMVAFTVKVLPEFFATAVELLAEMLLRPTFTERLVALEQDVVCEEIQEALDTPEDRLHDAFASRLYGGHSRGRPILGSAANVRSFSSSLLQTEHERLFLPRNLVIAMAGNIQEGFRDQVLTHFRVPGVEDAVPGPWQKESAGTPAAAIVGIDEEGFDPFRLQMRGPIVQTYFEIGNLGIPFHHDDRIPVYLLNNLLGGGMSSRIFQAVREREGLAYTVYTYADMGRDIGLVSCAGSCTPEKLERLEDIIRQEYYRLIHDGLAEAELESNRAQIKSQLIFSLEGMINQMFRSARNEIYYGRFVPVAELVTDIDAVGEDDIIRCAQKYFDPDALLAASHIPEKF